MRMMADVPPLRSDNGNLLLDCRFPDGIADADALEAQLRERSGVVESGLFLGMADTAILASADGIQVLHRGT